MSALNDEGRGKRHPLHQNHDNDDDDGGGGGGGGTDVRDHAAAVVDHTEWSTLKPGPILGGLEMERDEEEDGRGEEEGKTAATTTTTTTTATALVAAIENVYRDDDNHPHALLMDGTGGGRGSDGVGRVASRPLESLSSESDSESHLFLSLHSCSFITTSTAASVASVSPLSSPSSSLDSARFLHTSFAIRMSTTTASICDATAMAAGTTPEPSMSFRRRQQQQQQRQRQHQQHRHRQQQTRSLSDNLLGYSPMSRPTPSSSTTTKTKPLSPGEAGPSWATDAKSAQGGGGVWAHTSAKRNALAELKLELDRSKGQLVLDDAATEEQSWDLLLADGFKLVARATDGAWDQRDHDDNGNHGADDEKTESFSPSTTTTTTTTTTTNNNITVTLSSPSAPPPPRKKKKRRKLGPSSKSHPLLVELDAWMTAKERVGRDGNGNGNGNDNDKNDDDASAGSAESEATLTRGQFEAHLAEVLRILTWTDGREGVGMGGSTLYSSSSSGSKSGVVDVVVGKGVGQIDDLRHLRDFVVYDPPEPLPLKEEEAATTMTMTTTTTAADDIEDDEDDNDESDLRSAEGPFDSCVARLRVHLTRRAADRLSESWESLTMLSDADVDRAAVFRSKVVGNNDDGEGTRGEGGGNTETERKDKVGGGEGEGKENDRENAEKASTQTSPRTTLPMKHVHSVLRSYAFGDCQDRIESWWDLADADGDSMLEKSEMECVAWNVVRPVERAMRDFLIEATEATPVTLRPSTWEEEEEEKKRRDKEEQEGMTVTERGTARWAPSWRQRRREKKAKRRLTKLFDGTIANHFDVEVEMPHRLRCIYEWADKAHQGGKIDSVLVDAGAGGDGIRGRNIAGMTMGGGRKRYVELHPKISLAEFEQVQRKYLPHLCRAGEELAMSYKEDLLVGQGKGRQNRELRRDCLLFVACVSLIDVGINML